MKRIEPRLIYYNWGAASVASFDFTLNNIPFEPDYMVIKSISVYNNGATATLLLLRSNLTNKAIPMLAFPVTAATQSSSPLNLKFPLGKLIDGTYSFDLINVATGFINANIANMQLAFSVEFVKED